MAYIPGSTLDDTLSGTPQSDQIDGLDGNDLLKGLSGDDFLYGGTGLDTLHGSRGNDWLFGGDGNDRLYGDTGDDLLRGDAGHDILKGGDGNDMFFGGAGGDALYGGAGADLFRYTAATDSQAGGLDVIYDFEHGSDKIDLRALGYTGFTTGHTTSTELRVVYSAATDRTYLHDDHSDFEIALKGDYRGILTDDDFYFYVPPPPSVGYFNGSGVSGDDVPYYANPINALGYTAVSLDNLHSEDLAGLNAVFIAGKSSTFYGQKLLGAGSVLADYVSHGGVLIFQDNYVEEAERILPGLSGENIVRDTTNATDVNFIDDLGPIARGPGGNLSDTSLDSTTGSTAGYAFDGTLPSDVVRVQTTGDPSHVVSFAYTYGLGAVYYSSMPVGNYLIADDDPSDLTVAMRAYVENVLSWAVSGHHDLGLL